MIKTTVTPADTDLHIVLPADYVGKKLEVILYSIEEAEGQDTAKKTEKKPSEYAGSLSRNDAEKMLHHIEQSRN